MQQKQSEYTVMEERIHAASHGAGVILSIAGLWWMLRLSLEASDPWRIVASCVYGASLIALFLTSTLYHGLHTSPRRQLFKLFDHCAIYLLIAGTATPLLIVGMRTGNGLWLFGGMWLLAALGILSKIWFRHRYPKLSLASYLLMGWLMVIVTPQLLDAIGVSGMLWLVAGGACYTIGALFYMAKQMPFSHAIWHFFVLAGAVCHFIAVLYVFPVNGTLATSG
jgi:hemolysin III